MLRLHMFKGQHMFLETSNLSIVLRGSKIMSKHIVWYSAGNLSSALVQFPLRICEMIEIDSQQIKMTANISDLVVTV